MKRPAVEASVEVLVEAQCKLCNTASGFAVGLLDMSTLLYHRVILSLSLSIWKFYTKTTQIIHPPRRRQTRPWLSVELKAVWEVTLP